LQPTPERNKEIQQALIDRGYLAPPPTGVWGPESVAALRRFQQEQNLQPTGKLDSLSLIALGLGPKRSVTAQVRPNNENRSSEGNQGP
jgi:peptidoglycan hydrolase-like protein with peptidoglycan-binding domain